MSETRKRSGDFKDVYLDLSPTKQTLRLSCDIKKKEEEEEETKQRKNRDLADTYLR